jgi:hypothetical protein
VVYVLCVEDVLAVGLLALCVWLTFRPMFDATKHDRSAWPWIIGGLLTGPVSGLVYLTSNRAQRMAAERHGE